MNEPKKLYRSRKNRIIAGIGGGLGEYFEVDPIIFRILFVLLTLWHGVGLLIYIVLLLVVPKEPNEEGGQPVQTNAQEINEITKQMEEKAKSAIKEIKENKNWVFQAKNLFGLALIIIGLIALINVLFPSQIRWFSWTLIWPVIIIIIGIFLIVKQKNN